MAALEKVPPPDDVRAELGRALRRVQYLRRLLRLSKDLHEKGPPAAPADAEDVQAQHPDADRS